MKNVNENINNNMYEQEASCHCHEHEHHHEHDHGHEHHHGGEENNKGLIIKMITSAVFLAAALVVEHVTDGGTWAALPLYIIAYIIISIDVLRGAIANIKEGEVFGEEFLMAIASIGAFAIGEYAEACAVMLFYNLGEFLQDLAVDKSRDSITDLMDIRPDTANLLGIDGMETIVDPAVVHIGDIIVIKPGEKVPLDAIVTEGESLIDTSALTGESVPRTVRAGSAIISGCINTTGLIKARVTKEYSESTATKILELVENAADRKSRSENFINAFARIYTPIVCVLAVLVAFIPPLILKQPVTDWVYKALNFLVISCPCALVISVPLTFFIGIGTASHAGILVKGSNYLEALAKLETVVFDKTGTLTQGVFEVVSITPEGVSRQELLSYAALAEAQISHPIAKSIVKAFDKECGKNVDVFRITKLEQVPGKGVIAQINDKEVVVGNADLLESRGYTVKKPEEIGTVTYVAIDNKYEGSILISDKIKDDSPEAITGLKEAGVKKNVMLTGDNEDTAKAVSMQLGLDEYHANLLPADKVAALESILQNKETSQSTVAFVGDGVNDAPVLARADVGIAMGGLGSDAAIEAADVVIMDDKPSKIATGVKIASKTLKIAKQNVFLAIFIKVIIMVLSILGLVPMWAAVFADVGVALLCILNSTRNSKF